MLFFGLDTGCCTSILQNMFNDIRIHFIGLVSVIVIDLSTDADMEVGNFSWVFVNIPILL